VCASVRARGGGGALYFENDVAFRRVADYPDDWRDLPTGELEIVCRGRMGGDPNDSN